MLLILLAALSACRPWGDDRERIEDWSRRNLLGGLEVKIRTPIHAPEGAHAIVTIAATGDLKGWITNTVLYPRRRGAGLAHLAPVIADLRAGDPGLVLLDAGDIVHGALSGILPRRPSQGSAEATGAMENPGSTEKPGSRKEGGAGTSAFPIVKLMNALRYDAAALGNFDMSLGWEALGAAIAKSDFPWLSANLERTGGGTGGGTVLPPYRVLERNGVRIGILGMTTPRVAAYLAPRHLKNMAFSGMEAAARRWVPVLREIEGVDLVIGLFHSGLDDDYDREPILRGKVRIGGGAGKISDTGLGFDLIVSGDAHRLSPRRSTAALGAYAVPVLEPGARGNGLAVATIELSVQGGRWRVNRIARNTLSAESAPDPAAMARVSGELKTIAAHLGQPSRVRIRRVPRRGEFYRCAGALSHRAALSSGIADADAPFSLLPMRWRFEKPRLEKAPLKKRKIVARKKKAVKKRAVKKRLKKRESSKRKTENLALEKRGDKRKAKKKSARAKGLHGRKRKRRSKIQPRPLLRADLYRWMIYRENLVLASLTGRQIALLLEGYVRHLRKWVVRHSSVLWPGGLVVEVREKGSEIVGLRRGSDGAALNPRARYPVWLTDFVWNGGGGLAPKALIARDQKIAARPPVPGGAVFVLREAVFALLNDPGFRVPPECKRWLEQSPGGEDPGSLKK
ncbi:MAG: 5'-nucleotidase C-terminal domain-containing protein [SAR324 cluster bacterium]|nr:5'-nucleotidase C-terminal domain-containing protein [SAR324 cluster bacterium]